MSRRSHRPHTQPPFPGRRFLDGWSDTPGAPYEGVPDRIRRETRPVRPGDWIFAGDNGALRVPAGLVEEVVRRAEAVERTESRIRAAALGGDRLDEARARFGYARPWEDEGDHDDR
ncbi:hypothetical protein ACFVTC_03485 [Streptomyces sp. NPDC057950]|uniref:hypothetical protein n=1 Tax=Streptomyces sp. NPDC057950 TaxID=3346288 RepID=UPI0036E48C41